ncbi:MAG: DUF1616 domain-containing protein, partial [Candidatus Paceibacteria bacterium]
MRDQWEKTLTWILAAALIVSVIAVIGLAIKAPRTVDSYTEFYVLGQNEVAAGYPSELSTGESTTVILGITNHEHRKVTYRIVVTWNKTETTQRTVRVSAGKTREINVTLTAPQDPGRYRVRFLLYHGAAEGD